MKIDDIDSTIYSHSLVLPQSSISKEPIFRIQVTMKLYSMTPKTVRIDIKLRVECSVRAWGVSSFVEKFLISQAQNTYTNWLEFTNEHITKINKINKMNTTSTTTGTTNTSSMNHLSVNGSGTNNTLEMTSNDGDIIDMEEDLEEELEEDVDIIEINEFIIDPKNNAQSVNIIKPLIPKQIGVNYNENTVKKRGENDIVLIHKSTTPTLMQSLVGNNDHVVDVGLIEEEVHESRGLRKRENVPLRVKFCRCGLRICPSWFGRSKKKNDVDMMVDSRCECLEKSLWCVIVACCVMIILLTFHRYYTS